MARNTNLRWRLPVICLVLQVAMVILFGVFMRYDIQADAHWWLEKKLKNISSDIENDFYYRYPSLQDVHAMVFVGFGFLMTFLQRYGFSAVGFNFLLAAFGIQWALLMQGWFRFFEEGHIILSVENIIEADFCVASTCVAFGAVLGKISPVQLLIMTFFQVTLFAVNEYILLNLIEAKDAGGSMTIHTFGAYFGLTVTWILYRKNLEQSKQRQSSVYHSDLFAMIGGVGVGTAAEMMLTPYGALIVGFFCGIISTLGFTYLSPFLESHLRIQDTCGIHNLHGIPGIIGAIVGAVTAAYSSPDVYGEPGLVHSLGFGGYKADWTKRMQGSSQIFGLLLTLAMALVGGIIVGGLSENGGDSDKVSSKPGSAAEGLPLPGVTMLNILWKAAWTVAGREWAGPSHGVLIHELLQPCLFPNHTSHAPGDLRPLFPV
ncbi:hypothetical protein NN561_001448 [Cricetulus griseus]